MKTASILFVLLLHCEVFFGQNPNGVLTQEYTWQPHAFGDVEVFISPNVIMSSPHSSQLAGGLKLRMYMGKRFSFDSDLMIGRNYLHMGPGIIGLPLFFFGMDWILNSDGEISFGTEEDETAFSSLLFLGAVILLSAEHFAYHIPVYQNTDISPYISLLRLKNLTGLQEEGSAEEIESPTAAAIGIEFSRYYKRYILSPYIEYDMSYSGQYKGINIGFCLGYYFPYD